MPDLCRVAAAFDRDQHDQHARGVEDFQSAWLMRSLGEEPYRYWVVERLRETPVPLYLFCILAQSSLLASIGLH